MDPYLRIFGEDKKGYWLHDVTSRNTRRSVEAFQESIREATRSFQGLEIPWGTMRKYHFYGVRKLLMIKGFVNKDLTQ